MYICTKTIFLDINIRHSQRKSIPKALSIVAERHLTQKRQPTFRNPYQQNSIVRITVGAQTKVARFRLWLNMLLFWTMLILLVPEKPFLWLFDVLPWSSYTNTIVICILLDIWMVLTLTLSFTGTIGYEFYWDPYFRAPSLRTRLARRKKRLWQEESRRRAAETWCHALNSWPLLSEYLVGATMSRAKQCWW